MRPRRTPVVAGLLLVLAATTWLGSPAVAADGGPVELTLDRQRIETTVGRVLTVESRIANVGEAPLPAMIAHLNVTSTDPAVYVDLEDWSAEVTRSVEPLDPGRSTTLSWDFQAVNGGSFEVYVVLVPPAGDLVASRPVRVEVAKRRALNAGGALPVVLVVPALLGLLTVGNRYRLRRSG
jgi:hypothetical protein